MPSSSPLISLQVILINKFNVGNDYGVLRSIRKINLIKFVISNSNHLNVRFTPPYSGYHFVSEAALCNLEGQEKLTTEYLL